MVKRRYDEDYMRYGFSYIEDQGGQKPQSILCSEVLAHESMKPSKLKRHLETKHHSLKDKPVEYFRRQLQDLWTSQKCLTSSCSKQEQAVRASYQVAHRIAKLKKPHTIAEDLIFPAAMDMVREVLDQSTTDKLKTIPLSNDTINRRIEDMSEDIKQQTTARIKASGHFALQMDESTDITNKAVLLVYVRRVRRGLTGTISLHKRAPYYYDCRGHFQLHGLVFEFSGPKLGHVRRYHNRWRRLHDRKTSGVVRRILEKAPNATWNHCFLHGEALAAKDTVPVLHGTLKDVIQVVNYIKNRVQRTLCQDLGSELV